MTSESFLFSTELGPVTIEFDTIHNYDVDNIIRDRAFSQAMAVRLLNRGKVLNPNNLYGTRTLASAYTSTSEELPT